jgi:small multidrug resistance family-3 protein
MARMTTARIVILFALAALAEIGGAWLIWQAVRENRGWWLALLGIMALGAYGFVAALQPDANFGRVLAAYGGVFVAGSLAWGIVIDGFRPTMWDYIGSAVALVGAGIIVLQPSLGVADAAPGS